jgi:hypothetical protein
MDEQNKINLQSHSSSTPVRLNLQNKQPNLRHRSRVINYANMTVPDKRRGTRSRSPSPARNILSVNISPVPMPSRITEESLSHDSNNNQKITNSSRKITRITIECLNRTTAKSHHPVYSQKRRATLILQIQTIATILHHS